MPVWTFLLWLLGCASPGPLALEDPDGRPVEIALGPDERALVLHFWAPWCPSCAEELPLLEGAAARCRASGVRILVVDVAEDPETVRAFLAERGLALEPLRDPEGRAWRRLGARELPANWIRTREGARLEAGATDAAGWHERLAGLGCPASPEPE